jgi:large subunit ribosomal protein L49
VLSVRPHTVLSVYLKLTSPVPATPSVPTAPSQAPPAAPTTPQEAARAADLAAAEALTESDSAQPPEPKPDLPSKRSHTSTPKTPTFTKVPPSKADAVFPPSAPSPQTTPSNTLSALKLAPTSRTPSAVNISLPPPKYHVSRSASKNLPIYTDYKRGGNLHLTTVRKITGDLSALRDELRVYLNKKNEDVKINTLTQHVQIKGHVRGEVMKFLEARGM